MLAVFESMGVTACDATLTDLAVQTTGCPNCLTYFQ